VNMIAAVTVQRFSEAREGSPGRHTFEVGWT
jgi:hypothetical protein